jgi:carbon-monoxide dehydrogenase large subunit
MNKSIGQPLRRKEDERLLTGRGKFSDDFYLPNQAQAVMVRSPYPHAQITNIDGERTKRRPGVLGVFTGKDCAADGLGEIPHSPLPKSKNDLKLTGPNGSDVFIGPHMLLPTDKVRHVGEAIAMVVAETKALALDGAEAMEIKYEPLPHNLDTWVATTPGNPAIWGEQPDNVCIDTTFGDKEGTQDAFAQAAHVVEASFHVDRVTGVPIEPRSALASYDHAIDRYTIYAGSGGAVRQKTEIASVLGVEPDKIRVLSYDVGGNFGTRNRVYVEFALVAWAAKKLERPVKFTADRQESFLSDYQGRDLHTTVAMALDHKGRILALQADNISNVGARAVSFSPLGKGSALITGNYRVPVATIRARAVFTNTVPTQAYRSSGRPEVIFAIERLIELAALQLDMDPIELRRLNLVEADEMPYTNPFGMNYDSGLYHDNIEIAQNLADWAGIKNRRQEARSRGKLLGIGFANYVESSIGTPLEQTEITVRSFGQVDVVIGTQPSGQGHETSFAQVTADWLRLTTDKIQIIVGDTDVVKVGGGSHSGRSMRMAGTVIIMAADKLIEKGRKLAGHVMETCTSDIEFSDGLFNVKGTDLHINWFELAEKSENIELPEDLQGGLSVTISNEMDTPVFPNGCHICEVEVDPETGAVELLRYAAVDDVGRAINPMIVHGQTHGAVVQGLGQAMVEAFMIHPETGQTLSGSLMDYGLLRAEDVPLFKVALNEVPSPTNPLGIKAGGEGGTTSSPAAFINAVVDALREYGVSDLKMPATPFKVWQAIHGTQE